MDPESSRCPRIREIITLKNPKIFCQPVRGQNLWIVNWCAENPCQCFIWPSSPLFLSSCTNDPSLLSPMFPMSKLEITRNLPTNKGWQKSTPWWMSVLQGRQSLAGPGLSNISWSAQQLADPGLGIAFSPEWKSGRNAFPMNVKYL